MALIASLMAMLLMAALAAGLTMMTTTESAIAVNHRSGVQALYAAESGVELATSQLRSTADWAVLVSNGPAVLFTIPLSDVVQASAFDSRFVLTVTASPDPSANPDVLVLQSVATGPGGSQRVVQVEIRRLPPDESGARVIETSSWR